MLRFNTTLGSYYETAVSYVLLKVFTWHATTFCNRSGSIWVPCRKNVTSFEVVHESIANFWYLIGSIN